MFEGWVDRTEGRKSYSKGRIVQDDVVTCEAEGLFIQVDRERIRNLGGV